MARISFLENVRYDKALKLCGGRFAHNYRELAKEIEWMSDAEFSDFTTKGYNEIIGWIVENYNDTELVRSLQEKHERKHYVKAINKRIATLEKHGGKSENQEGKQQCPPIKLKPAPFVILALSAIIVVLLIVIASQHRTLSGVNEELAASATSMSKIITDLTEQNNLLDREIKGLQEKNVNLMIENERIREGAMERKQANLAPENRIAESDISLRDGTVSVSFPDSFVARIAATGSMLPVLDENSNAIEIVPKNESEISVGDIIGYKTKTFETVIHRVIEVGTDASGWYAITKGDNNPLPDTEKVRFSAVHGIVVGIVY